LSGTAPRAARDTLKNQLLTLKAAEARLVSARDGREEVIFPDAVTQWKYEPAVQEILDTQARLFDTQWKALIGKISVLEKRIAQSSEEIGGLQAQAEAYGRQLEYFTEEIETVKTLLEKRIAPKPRLLALQREAAALEGRRGEALAAIARAEQNINADRLEIINAQNDYQKDIVAELKDVQSQIPGVEERLRAAEDVLKRVEIAAPQAGIVTGLAVHTKGGVISPGATLMEIVPQDDRLVVDARVNPRDIDEVHAGLSARLRLSAYKARRVPVIEGKVTQVSADRFVDKNSNESYYTARLIVDEEALKRLHGVELYPGMPVEVLIVTGERTFMSYLLSPLSDGMFRAFREP